MRLTLRIRSVSKFAEMTLLLGMVLLWSVNVSLRVRVYQRLNWLTTSDHMIAADQTNLPCCEQDNINQGKDDRADLVSAYASGE